MNQVETNVDFGTVVQYLKLGGIAYRSGWNGKGMYLFLKKGSRDISEKSPDILQPGADNVEGIPFHLFNQGDERTYTRLPHIAMKNANGRIVTGWLASQTDILAEDWSVEISN